MYSTFPYILIPILDYVISCLGILLNGFVILIFWLSPKLRTPRNAVVLSISMVQLCTCFVVSGFRTQHFLGVPVTSLCGLYLHTLAFIHFFLNYAVVLLSLLHLFAFTMPNSFRHLFALVRIKLALFAILFIDLLCVFLPLRVFHQEVFKDDGSKYVLCFSEIDSYDVFILLFSVVVPLLAVIALSVCILHRQKKFYSRAFKRSRNKDQLRRENFYGFVLTLLTNVNMLVFQMPLLIAYFAEVKKNTWYYTLLVVLFNSTRLTDPIIFAILNVTFLQQIRKIRFFKPKLENDNKKDRIFTLS